MAVKMKPVPRWAVVRRADGEMFAVWHTQEDARKHRNNLRAYRVARVRIVEIDAPKKRSRK